MNLLCNKILNLKQVLLDLEVNKQLLVYKLKIVKCKPSRISIRQCPNTNSCMLLPVKEVLISQNSQLILELVNLKFKNLFKSQLLDLIIELGQNWSRNIVDWLKIRKSKICLTLVSIILMLLFMKKKTKPAENCLKLTKELCSLHICL